MSVIKIMFSKPQDILEFVNKVEKYPYNMDIRRGQFMVDAKSLMGLMNIGVYNAVNLIVHADDCDDLRKDIATYIAA